MDYTHRIIQPVEAKAMLEANPHKRYVSKSRVTHFARQISNGTFDHRSTMIQINPEGRILDGIHRLHAAVEADQPLPAYILFTNTKQKQVCTKKHGAT